jgi:amidophosphoribosyltransferase
MCGILGVVATTPVNQLLYDGLQVLQHRGQDAAGIATAEGGRFHMHKGSGLVRDVFRTRNMRSLEGNWGIGHCRYPTAGSAYNAAEAQPFYVNSPFGLMLAHNGNLTNADRAEARDVPAGPAPHQHQLRFRGAAQRAGARAAGGGDQGPSSTPRPSSRRWPACIAACRGAYAVVAMIAGYGLLAFRDPYGIRPLVIGRNERRGHRVPGGLGERGARHPRLQAAARRGAGRGGAGRHRRRFHSSSAPRTRAHAPCIFEFVYLARPDSVIDGISVYESRVQDGRAPGREDPPHHAAPRHRRGDPDSRLQPPVGDGTGRRLEPALPRGLRQEPLHRPHLHHARAGQRRKSVRQKLNAITRSSRARTCCWSTTPSCAAPPARRSSDGARGRRRKVYFASAAPPVRFANVYGIDMPTRGELIAADRSDEEIAARSAPTASSTRTSTRSRRRCIRSIPVDAVLRDLLFRRPLHHRRRHRRVPQQRREPAQRSQAAGNPERPGPRRGRQASST